jgi:hypothetical protein
MEKREVKIGQTDYTVLLLIKDTSFAPKTGLTFESAGIDVCYTRIETDNDVVVTAGAPVTTTLTGAHVDWGFVEVDATNAPGLYKLDLPDAVFATGAWMAFVSLICTGCTPTHIEFILVPELPYNGVDLYSIRGTAQTANDNGADINSILVDTNELQTDWADDGRLDLLIDSIIEFGTEIHDKLPSRDYLAGSTESTGAIVDKTGYILAEGSNDVIIAGAVWDSLTSGYGLIEDTFGYILKAIIAEAGESALFTSTPSDAELCTLALFELGQEGINSFDDGTKRSILCKYFYPIIRDAVLRAYPWNFAITRQELAEEETSPLYGYSYSYALPTDPYCLRALEMEETEGTFKIEGRHLFTDEGSVKLKYIARIINAGLYDSLFREALIARLAATLAYPITRTTSVSRDMWALYEAKLREARTMSGMEGTIDQYESDDLTTVR